MGCIIAILALVSPRITLALVWLFGPPGYLSEPYPSIVWPILGFIFLPTTTLAFSYSSHSLSEAGSLTPLGWVLVVVGLVVDVGLHGGGGRAARRRRRRERDRERERDQD